MNKRAIWAITRKDIRAITANFQVWLPMAIVPVILGIVLPAVLVAVTARMPFDQVDKDMAQMAQWLTKMPLPPAAGQSMQQQVVFMLANYTLAAFYLMIPIMSASVVCADSFAGEKERGTLETLLFAPVDLLSLLVGKALAAFLPTMALSLGTLGISAVAVNVAGWNQFGHIFFPQVNWLPLMLLVVPMVSLLVILVSVFISAKVATFQAAYQMGGVMILPAMLLVGGQLSGLLMLGTSVMLIFGVVLAIINAILLRFVLKGLDRNRLFQGQVR